MSKILVVEDNVLMRQNIIDCLKQANYVVDTTDDGIEAEELLKLHNYDLIILDWNLPGLSGSEICRRYRSSGGKSPVIFLTARSDFEDKSEGFQSGADDYLTKPVDVRELLLRVKALLRRPPLVHADILSIGALILNLTSGKVTYRGKQIKLNKKELQLLAFFMRHPDTFFSADSIIEQVWKSDSDIGEVAIRSYIAKIRKKIDPSGDADFIVTERGLGYKLVVENLTQ